MKKTLSILLMLLFVASSYAQNTIQSVASNENQIATKKFYPQQFEANAGKATIVLWDNTNINIVDGLPGGTAAYWSGNDNWAWPADDFDAEGPWIIEKIYSKGYYPDPDHSISTKMAIVIYLNDEANCKPGEEIYRNTNIAVADVLEAEIVLPEPFQLPSAGKYWISIAAVFDVSVEINADVLNQRIYLSRGTVQKGCNYHYYDKKALFTGYEAETWMDAGPITNVYSTYFKIEGDPGITIDCQPVTNLTAVYGDNCTKTELTWTAPQAKGDFKYTIYRDGEKIATVETEAYTDLTFEPTLAHSWDIVVECDGYSPPTRVSLGYCKAPDCALMPKNINIEYVTTEESCEAKIQWLAPTELLFDNFVNSGSGYASMRWLWEENTSRSIIADDFDVPPGETWVITEVYGHGFYSVGGDEPHVYERPDYIGVEIYDDNGFDLPGNKIYENAYLTPIHGVIGQNFTVLLSEPVIISAPGKYWVSYYGAYDNEYHDERYFVALCFPESRGALYAHLDETESSEWEPFTNGASSSSLSFNLLGSKNEDPIFYNIYRDGVMIQENVTELSYTDTEFDPTLPHTWSVKMVCPEGGVSSPTYLTVNNCKEPNPDNVNENENTSFTIYPNPSSNNITITTENNVTINAVQIINFLGQIVFSQSNINNTAKTLDVSNLDSGVYFVRVVAENGTAIQKFVKR